MLIRWMTSASGARFVSLGEHGNLRQEDVAVAARVPQALVSNIEAGRLTGITSGTLRRVFAAVDARFEGTVLWRGPGLDRLLDADHSRLVGAGAERLRAPRWDQVLIEVSYSVFGERGSLMRRGLVSAARPTLDISEADVQCGLEPTPRLIYATYHLE